MTPRSADRRAPCLVRLVPVGVDTSDAAIAGLTCSQNVTVLPDASWACTHRTGSRRAFERSRGRPAILKLLLTGVKMAVPLRDDESIAAAPSLTCTAKWRGRR